MSVMSVVIGQGVGELIIYFLKRLRLGLEHAGDGGQFGGESKIPVTAALGFLQFCFRQLNLPSILACCSLTSHDAGGAAVAPAAFPTPQSRLANGRSSPHSVHYQLTSLQLNEL